MILGSNSKGGGGAGTLSHTHKHAVKLDTHITSHSTRLAYDAARGLVYKKCLL